MNDSETDSQSIKALIVFRENGETDNLFVPILCDAARDLPPESLRRQGCP